MPASKATDDDTLEGMAEVAYLLPPTELNRQRLSIICLTSQLRLLWNCSASHGTGIHSQGVGSCPTRLL